MQCLAAAGSNQLSPAASPLLTVAALLAGPGPGAATPTLAAVSSTACLAAAGREAAAAAAASGPCTCSSVVCSAHVVWAQGTAALITWMQRQDPPMNWMWTCLAPPILYTCCNRDRTAAWQPSVLHKQCTAAKQSCTDRLAEN